MTEQAYLDLLEDILYGEERPDRTGTGTLSLFAPAPLRFNLARGFPLLTTKKMHWKGVVAETLWMLSGSTNAFDLPTHTQKWWTPWAKEDGSLGPLYGTMLRAQSFEDQTCDQVKLVEHLLKTDPHSRRILWSTWNSAALPLQRLPCCHGTVTQFYVSKERRTLSCHMYQRSADAFIGLPVNIASYALLTHMLASCHGFTPGTLTISLGDAHIYKNHIAQVEEQLGREPRVLPKLILEPKYSILEYREDDIRLVGYDPLPAIKAEVSV